MMTNNDDKKRDNIFALALLTLAAVATLQPVQAKAADIETGLVLNAGTYTFNATESTANSAAIGGTGILGATAAAENPNGLAATAGIGARLMTPINAEKDLKLYGEAGVKQLEQGKVGQYLSAGIDKRVYTVSGVDLSVGALAGARKSDVTGEDKTDAKLGFTASAEAKNGFGVRATLYPTGEYGHAKQQGATKSTTTGILGGLSGLGGGSSDGASVTLDFTFAFNK